MTLSRLLVVTGALVAAAVAGAVYHWVRESRRKPAGTSSLSQILLYPIKSGPALIVHEAECTETGLKYKNVRDR